jgi:hypothetical protein
MSAATTNLREPDKIDWENHNPQSSWTPPPPAKDAAGQYIVYTAKLPKDLGRTEKMGVTDEGYRSFEFGPLVVALPGGKATDIRYFGQSVRKYQKKDGTPLEVSGVSKVLRAAGFAGKPQTNAEYEAAVRSIAGRNIQITIEWRAKNKDTNEEVKGYDLFPLDEERPGQRKAILRKGDKLTDGTVITSDVLFANPVVRYVEGR